MEIVKENGMISSGRIFGIDFFLLNVSFLISYFFKKGTFDLTGSYLKLLFLFYLCWFFASMVGKKFKPSSYITCGTGIATLLTSSLYLIYLITFCVVVLGLAAFSRVHVFSTCLMLLVLDCLACYIYSRIFNPGAFEKIDFKHVSASIRMENNIAWPL
ncbi:MAG TPA: hypothetical protein ENK36_05595, partial [Desulfobacterales bacterium]|nr:hypothetical protein [Desulfobacterales bacterium]